MGRRGRSTASRYRAEEHPLKVVRLLKLLLEVGYQWWAILALLTGLGITNTMHKLRLPEKEIFADSGLNGSDKAFDGAMFALRGFSGTIGAFVFEFSRAAGCVIFPAMEPACVLLPREDLAGHLPTDLGEDFQHIPITNGAELIVSLNGGYDSWRAYRDHLLRVSADGPAGGT